MYEAETVAIGQDVPTATATTTAAVTGKDIFNTLLQQVGGYMIAKQTQRSGSTTVSLPTLPGAPGAPVMYPPAPAYKPSYTPMLIGVGLIGAVILYTMRKKSGGRRRR